MSSAATPPPVTLEPPPTVPEFTNPLRPGVAPSADCADEILMEARVALLCRGGKVKGGVFLNEFNAAPKML